MILLARGSAPVLTAYPTPYNLRTVSLASKPRSLAWEFGALGVEPGELVKAS